MLPLLTRLDHVGIACRDLDRAVALYQATFGLEVASLEINEEQEDWLRWMVKHGVQHIRLA